MRRLVILILLTATSWACQPIDDADDAGTGGAGGSVSGELDAERRDQGSLDGSVDAQRRADAGDAGSGDVASSPDSAPDAATPDVGPPPVACPVAWTRLTENIPQECAGRRVLDLAQGVAGRSVAVARSAGGRVAIGWADLVLFDAGNYELRVLNGSTGEVLASHVLEGVELEGELFGNAAAFAVLRETFHIVLWVRSDFGGRIEYRRIQPDNALTAPEVVTGVVGRFGVLDITVDAPGVAHTAWHDKNSGALAVRDRAADGTWSMPYTLDTDLDERTPADGSVSLALGVGRVLHAAYQRAQSVFGAVPIGVSRIGELWQVGRTLDNNANNRLSGVGVKLVAYGEDRVAAYLDWVDGTGQLRLARWSTNDEPIAIEVLIPGMAIESPPASFALALGIDANGHLHLVTHRPGAEQGTLEYRYQTPSGWLVETIDDVVPGSPREQMVVDLHVSDDASVHIVWWDPSSGAVHYASRQK